MSGDICPSCNHPSCVEPGDMCVPVQGRDKRSLSDPGDRGYFIDVAGLDPCLAPSHTTTHPVHMLMFDANHEVVGATYTCGHWGTLLSWPEQIEGQS